MIGLKVANNRFDLYPLFQGSFEPGGSAVWVRHLSFLGNGYSCNAPSSTAVFLFFEGLIESSIPGDFPGRLSNVHFNSGYHLAQGLHISDIALIFHMRQNQAVVILRESNDGAELTIGMTLPLLDDSHIRLMRPRPLQLRGMPLS